MSNERSSIRVSETGGGRWVLAGAGDLTLVNDYLGYVADRGYSPRTVRAYAFDLLHFARWLVAGNIAVGDVDTDVLLRYLAVNRAQWRDGQDEDVIALARGRASGFAPSTINRRLAAISGLFMFRSMRDPDAVNPVPKGPAARRTARGERTGLLGHLARPKPRSRLRVREPRRLPRGLDRAETAALLGSFRTDRDRAIAGLMLLSGLRSAEVPGLRVADVDIARGWVRVTGKGDKERSVPLDPDVAGLIQSYLLAERPETASKVLFVVAKGPHRGQPLTSAGLRRVFRYHREISGVTAGRPHALRRTFGTAMAEAGVDLPVLQQLMGHDHVESSAACIHLAPAHVRAACDAARQRQRAAQAGDH
ncbi:MAG: tyrosine-type recombinase/integrase [Streptosporangiaceae bacterium]